MRIVKYILSDSGEPFDITNTALVSNSDPIAFQGHLQITERRPALDIFKFPYNKSTLRISTVMELQSYDYAVQEDRTYSLILTESGSLEPLTSMYPDKSLVATQDIQDQLREYQEDDVFSPKFFYQPLNTAAYGATTLSIAVPSRLYFMPTKELPLAGKRIAVKDVLLLTGVATTCGNRAYARLYKASSVSSAAVQKVLGLDAIVIGKTKTAEFAGSQEVIGDWTDYSYALNPRGDGYIVSTGSSTGSASSIASYSWLDGALGTDAGRSIRDPAAAQAIFALRPTHDGSVEGNTPPLCP
ncbi:amidase signature enzyme [Patellaria atrata CBS 101060]|uniref:Amidase signature enzyme n=1 Tax=Patellaria atrata CBS 101060 TaxID=1346257 RepID=A0A9P4VNU7_9PEZI|nr:amidase signature enzyme [Patellaria atrata CBS 101060]